MRVVIFSAKWRGFESGEAVNQQNLALQENRYRQFLQKLKNISPRRLLHFQTWYRVGLWLLWNISLKRRAIKDLIKHLGLLDQNVMSLRNEVFAQICLKLKMEDRQKLLDLLGRAQKPSGFDQIFLSAIYPQVLNRNLGIVPLPTEADNRLDVEMGYLGYNEEYFFWVLEIDGAVDADPDRTLVPEQKTRDDNRYLVYRLGVANLVKADQNPLDAMQWIINAQIYFNRVLADLKRRNYKITAVTIPHFELGRLSLLRRLALDELKKRQFRS